MRQVLRDASQFELLKDLPPEAFSAPVLGKAYAALRERYKEFVCDSIQNAILKEAPAASLKGILSFEYWFYALMSGSCRIDMQHLYTQCKEMMDVSDQQIAVYKEARLRMEKEGSGAATADDSRSEKILDLQKKIEEGRKKLKLE